MAQENEQGSVLILQSFIQSTVNVMTKQIFAQMQLLTLYRLIKSAGSEFEVSASIQFKVNNIFGLFTLCLPQASCTAVSEKMFGKPFHKNPDEVRAALGEIVQSILGSTKTLVEEKLGELRFGIATVTAGKQVSNSYVSEAPTFILPFDTDLGPVHFEVNIGADISNLDFKNQQSPNQKASGLGKFSFATPILVVDDALSARMIVIKFLKEMGFLNFHESSDGSSAWKYLEEHPEVGLLICDWHMPGMSGLELVTGIRNHAKLKALPILMVTLESDKKEVAQAISKGVNAYILKPVTRQSLEQKILKL